MSIIKNGSRDLVKSKEGTSIYGSASFKSEGKSIIKDSDYNTELNKSFVNRSTSEQSLDKVINNERIYRGNNESLYKSQSFNNGYGDTGSRKELINRVKNSESLYKNNQYTSTTIRKEERLSETIVKNNIPNIKNYDIQGNKRKKLNIVRNNDLKVKGRYTNIIENLKYIKSVNFSRIKKEFFKARYIRTVLDNGIDNLNSSDNDYGNTLAKEKMYRMVSAPRDVIRAGRSLKRAYNGAKNVKDVARNLKSISNIKAIKLKRVAGKGITTSLINEVNSLRGNENIGIQSIVKTKDAVVTTKNTIRYSAKAVKKFTKFSYNVGKRLTIMTAKLFSNPVILKVLAGLGAVVIALSLIASIFIGFISIFIGENSNVDLAVPNEEQRAFILKLVPIAQDNYNEYGIFPSVTIAQAIHESAWGKSDLSVQANNLFGVKADENWKGETIEMPTKEYINGEEIIVIAKWRKYASFEDSIRDHGKFLKENSRYENAGVFKAKDYKEQAYAIRMAGYATDPQYASLICNIIESYSLSIYDFKVGEGNKVVERAITTGMSIVGKSPYVFGGGRNPEDIAALKFDCSSFVHWCYANGGLNLGDYKSVVTFSLVTMGKEIAPEDMKRGDLIFFNTEGVTNNHVGIYLGDNKFLHDAEPNGVWINSLDEGYWKNAFNGNVRRVVE